MVMAPQESPNAPGCVAQFILESGDFPIRLLLNSVNHANLLNHQQVEFLYLSVLVNHCLSKLINCHVRLELVAGNLGVIMPAASNIVSL